MAEVLLTTGAIADRLGVSYQTVREWIENGKLKAYNFGRYSRNLYRVKMGDFETFLANCTTEKQKLVLAPAKLAKHPINMKGLKRSWAS